MRPVPGVAPSPSAFAENSTNGRRIPVKKLLIGLAVLVGVLVVAILVVPSLIDWNDYKPEIQAQAKKATGRDLFIDGDISLSLLPAPALSASRIRLAGPPGAEAKDMVSLKELDVRVAFGPLLGGNVQVQSIRLIEPTILLEVAKDGTPNWQFQPAGDAAPAQPGSDGGGSAGTPAGLSLDDIRIENGTLIYRDARNGQEQRIEGLNVQASAGSLQGPFDAAGDLRANGMPLGFEARVGELKPGQPVPLKAVLSQKEGGTSAEFSGNVAMEDTPSATGRLKLAAANVAELIQRFQPGTAAPAMLAKPFGLDSQLTASAEAARLSDLKVSLGDLAVNGSAEAKLGAVTEVAVKLAASRLDLDALLPKAGAAAAGSAKPAEAPAAKPASAPGGGFALPTGIKADLDLAIEGVQYRGDAVRQVKLQAGLTPDGKARLGRLSALLPGGSDVNLTGNVAPADGQPRFDGRLEMASDNLRGLLQWLQADVGQVPSGRLGSMTATGAVQATPALVRLAGLNVRLDQSTLTGGLSFRPGVRPAVGADLALDRINLDGYLPQQAAARPQQGGAPATAAKPAAGEAKPLAALAGFDADVKLAVQQLVYNQTPVEGVTLDVQLANGNLDIRKASVRNLAGATASVAGNATGLAGEPKLSLNLDVAANDLGGVARLAGVALPVSPQRLGKATLKATLEGDTRAAKFDGQAAVAGATARLAGTAADLQGKPSADLKLDASHPSLAALANTLELGLKPLQGADRPLRLAGTVKSGPEAVDLNLDGDLAGAATKLTGRVQGLETTPALDLRLDLDHPDARAFLRTLGIDYRPALDNFGGAKLALAMNGPFSAVRIPELKGNLGPAAFTGSGNLKLDGPRPYLEAALNANEIVVDMLLPPQGAAAPAGQPQAAGRAGGGAQQAPARSAGPPWSREPLDLAGLSAADADVQVHAAALTFREYRFVEPKLKVALKDGTLSLQELNGRLFDGIVSLTGQLASKPTPSLRLNTSVQQANLEKALGAAMQTDKVTGLFNFKADLTSAGGSQYDLVRGLKGAAELKAEKGEVRGVSLRSLSDRLKEINGWPDFLDLMARSVQGGATPYSSIAGVFRIDQGVARTDDLAAHLDAAEGHMKGAINLAAWEMDMTGEAALVEHPKAPPIGVNLYGPLDNVQRDLKTQALEQYFAQRLVGGAVGKQLGDKVPPELQQLLGLPGGRQQQPQGQPAQPQRQQQQEQQQQKQDPRGEAIQGIFNLLNKR